MKIKMKPLHGKFNPCGIGKKGKGFSIGLEGSKAHESKESVQMESAEHVRKAKMNTSFKPISKRKIKMGGYGK